MGKLNRSDKGDDRMDVYHFERWLIELEIAENLRHELVEQRQVEELEAIGSRRKAESEIDDDDGSDEDIQPVTGESSNEHENDEPITEQVRVVHENYYLSRTLKQEFGHLAALLEPIPFVSTNPDALNAAQDELTRRYPWVSKALRTLFGRMRWRFAFGHSTVQLTPTLVVGPSGCGKSRLAADIAQALHVPVMQVQASGDPKVIEATGAGWGTSRPSLPIEFIAQTKIVNPIVVVDEIDKIDEKSRHNGNLMDVLLGFLERHTARRAWDSCLRTPTDLSHVNWILTANSVGSLPAHLLSRLQVIDVEQPGRSHMNAVLETVYDDLSHELGVAPQLLPSLQPHHRQALNDQWGPRTSLRAVRRMAEHLIEDALSAEHDQVRH